MHKVSDLINLLGGTGMVAKRLNIKPSAISNWKKLNKIPNNKKNDLKMLGLDMNVRTDQYLTSKNFSNLEGSVLLIISGGIACYKSLEIIRLLKKTNIQLDVIITKSAQQFITPLLITSLNEKKCYTDLFSIEDETQMNHIALARKPDIILVAPATANIIAKIANGIADDLASTTLLASYSKIIIAPSMNPVMWNNLATKENCQKLLNRGISFIEPDSGDMACGESGNGRLPEPQTIFNELLSKLSLKKNTTLKDISVIVTAGPTIEEIDPVRFVSNRSSGKQGFAIASELSNRGANVTLITGPVDIPLPLNLKTIQITTAQEMFEKTMSQLPSDVVVCTAAVADWKLIPETQKNEKFNPNTKIKKTDEPLTFKTIKNPDIISEIANSKSKPKLIIGFSAETENVVENARDKLKTKNIDLIIANDVSNNRVFGKESNKVYVIDKKECEEWPEQNKKSVAFKIADRIYDILSCK
ncbi:MAG: bifunctional phosphopantothenoylcysteine decarboxylase/phosphopantothenate--cysteine ligase CoaBC [Alphaproteobacteria bacterium]|nr:bifunctional phosphopantothenoylcysteine decarboxylase/phosphopantothenate--cysteine ligase CoaBC [Alphaproteobacteria bacterium]